MAEADFQTELGRGFDARAASWHYYKIPDMPHFLARQSSVNLKRPYDCYALGGGVFLAMELKQARGLSINTQSDKSGDLTPEQEDALLSCEANGGCGYVLVNFLTKISAKEAKRLGLTAGDVLNVAYAAPISAVVSARRELARNSIPLSWWEQRGVRLPEIRVTGKPAWDPQPLLTAALLWRQTEDSRRYA